MMSNAQRIVCNRLIEPSGAPSLCASHKGKTKGRAPGWSQWRGFVACLKRIPSGVAAALVVLMLLSVSIYVELRHAHFGEFMRDSAADIQEPHVSDSYMARYRDPLTYLLGNVSALRA